MSLSSRPASLSRRPNCRLCDSPVEHTLRLPDTPLANELTSFTDDPVELFPLELKRCVACRHVQLGHVVSPERLYGHYSYATGVSESFRKHFFEYASTLSSIVPPGGLVVEIGSNDGTLLREFKDRGYSVHGIEPSSALAWKAISKNLVPTFPMFFTSTYARTLACRSEQADCVIANNVLAHIDDLDDVMHGVSILLKPGGLFVFEVQYLGDMLKHGLFDMIYHEHLDYHHLTPLVPFLARHDLDLYDVERVPTHGGSIRCFARKVGPSGLCGQASRAREMLAEEAAIPPDALSLGMRVAIAVAIARDCFKFLNLPGRIAGYGAPAKLTTLAYACGIDGLQYVVDDNPMKQGKYTPGKHWPIVPSSRLAEDPVDYLVLFAWNVAEECMKRARAAGFRGKFVIPLPVPTIVE